MRLIEVNENDYNFLYKLLKARPEYCNISHVEMPTIEEHVRFIESKPYKAWYVIVIESTRMIGAVYLTRANEIGIFLLEKYRNQGYGKQAITRLMVRHPEKEYYANIAPTNQPSLAMFSKIGIPIQTTFRIKPLPECESA